jgi:hypothetical protein
MCDRAEASRERGDDQIMGNCRADKDGPKKQSNKQCLPRGNPYPNLYQVSPSPWSTLFDEHQKVKNDAVTTFNQERWHRCIHRLIATDLLINTSAADIERGRLWW